MKKSRGCELELEKAAHADKCEDFKRVFSVRIWRGGGGAAGGRPVKKDTLKLIEKIDKKKEDECNVK